MPQLYTITNWLDQPYYSTKGTRNKTIVIGPKGEQYYFKTSLYKPGKDYKYEFWSEIIAYELGSMLGLNVLRYDLAIQGVRIGCLCKSMIESEKEILTEGVQYLQGYDPNFAPADSKGGTAYTFDLICRSLSKFNLQSFHYDIIDLIIFDSIIGNGDRHQENWGFITDHTVMSKRYVEFVRNLRNSVKSQKWWIEAPSWLKYLIKKIYFKGTTQQLREEILFMNFTWNKNIRFAPIYDNGSSLARELSEERVSVLLNSEAALENYINNGLAEIHWDGKKISHFELIKLVLKLYPERTSRIKEIIEKFNQDRFLSVLENLDLEVPVLFEGFKMTSSRKQLILKLVDSRITRLASLIN